VRAAITFYAPVRINIHVLKLKLYDFYKVGMNYTDIYRVSTYLLLCRSVTSRDTHFGSSTENTNATCPHEQTAGHSVLIMLAQATAPGLRPSLSTMALKFSLTFPHCLN
jgi:hypothetical protein